MWLYIVLSPDKRQGYDKDRGRIAIWPPKDQGLSHYFNIQPDQADSRDCTFGFVSKDEAYATAILVVVKAHQSRATIGGKVELEMGGNCSPITGMSSFSPRSFVIAMTPTCGCSLLQKPVESSAPSTA